MGKATSVPRIVKGLETAHAAGIRVRGFFITGFPGETDETVSESLSVLEALAGNAKCLDEATVYPCIPYPGTDIPHVSRW